MYKLQLTLCSQIPTKHSMQSKHRVEFRMLNLAVRKETARF